MTFFDILSRPSRVSAETDSDTIPLTPQQDDTWTAGDLCVRISPGSSANAIELSSPSTPVRRVYLRWQGSVPRGVRILGDHWERGYGDLEWRGIVPERVLPWYFLAHDGGTTWGCGAMTGAGALCSWRVDASGVSLVLDVRSGAEGVRLGGRPLTAARLVRFEATDASPFAAAGAFCRLLCPEPRMPFYPVYGSNDWYYSYGNSTRETILRDADIVVAHAPDTDNRPFMTIDDGWQRRVAESESFSGTFWDGGNADFGDMAALAAEIRARGARPGIWIRPLLAPPGTSDALLLPAGRARDQSARAAILDPSVPEVRERIAADFARLRAWGYELIKHDWTTCDLLGRWGFDMGAEMTNPGWRFADGTRTTAEIVRTLFQTIREGAGDAVIIGCNTIGHLAAGLFELQRTGDDTSGREWERTRKMGVNTLAFRMPQHGAFFAADADCVGLTNAIPWEKNRQWLDLLARSGTPLFVSAAPDALGGEQSEALRAAFAAAAQPHSPGEPLDWMDTTCPTEWRLKEGVATYDWTAGV